MWPATVCIATGVHFLPVINASVIPLPTVSSGRGVQVWCYTCLHLSPVCLTRLQGVQALILSPEFSQAYLLLMLLLSHLDSQSIPVAPLHYHHHSLGTYLLTRKYCCDQTFIWWLDIFCYPCQHRYHLTLAPVNTNISDSRRTLIYWFISHAVLIGCSGYIAVAGQSRPCETSILIKLLQSNIVK